MNRRRIRAYSTAFLLVTVLGWLFNAVTGQGLLDRWGQIIGTDFAVNRAAAQLIAENRGAELYLFTSDYHFPALDGIVARTVSPQVVQGNFPFFPTPVLTLPYLPLAFLPYLAGYAIWVLLNVVLLFAVLRMLRPYVALLRGPDSRLAVFVILSFFPVLETLMDGQLSLLSFAMIALVYVAWKQGRDGLAGLALGSLVYKPQLILVILLYCLVSRRWRTLVVAGITAAALALLSFLWIGPLGVQRYLSLAGTFGQLAFIPGFKLWNQHSLYGFFALLTHDPNLTQFLTLAVCAPVVLALLYAWSRNRELEQQYSLAVLATLLVTPHLFGYDLTLLILPGVLQVDRLQREKSHARTWTVVLTLAYLAPLLSREVALLLGIQLSVPILGAWLCLAFYELLVQAELSKPQPSIAEME